MAEMELTCAGSTLPEARDDIRRYCGLTGPDGEAAAPFRYFDTVPTHEDDLIGPGDILGAFVICPGAGRDEMVWFNGGGAAFCEQWLGSLPADVDLADADEATVDRICEFAELTQGIRLDVATAVVHHKRPRLVPCFSTSLASRYRPLTGSDGEEAWPALVRSLRHDLAQEGNRAFLDAVCDELRAELDEPVPSRLRLADIAVAMSA